MTALSVTIISWLPRIIGGIAIIVLFWIVATVARTMLQRLVPAAATPGPMTRLVATTGYYTILIIGLLTGLDTMGVRTGPVMASLGLGGFALGFALKDVISNLLAGVLIVCYRPFTPGDYLVVAGCEGHVTEINMRYTILAGSETTYLIPNAVIFTTPLQRKGSLNISSRKGSTS